LQKKIPSTAVSIPVSQDQISDDSREWNSLQWNNDDLCVFPLHRKPCEVNVNMIHRDNVQVSQLCTPYLSLENRKEKERIFWEHDRFISLNANEGRNFFWSRQLNDVLNTSQSSHCPTFWSYKNTGIASVLRLYSIGDSMFC
jgi:hypothetical protein